LSGVLDIQALRFSPGPVAQQFILLGRQVEAIAKRRLSPEGIGAWDTTIVEVNQCRVPFRMTAGRVYHQGLVMSAGAFRMITRGSVGLDQSLEVLVETRLDREKIGDAPWARWLEGRTIEVPVRGTFGRPAVDPRFFNELVGQLAREGTQQASEEVLSRELEKVFRPRK
jgi:hypothetical protein